MLHVGPRLSVLENTRRLQSLCVWGRKGHLRPPCEEHYLWVRTHWVIGCWGLARALINGRTAGDTQEPSALRGHRALSPTPHPNREPTNLYSPASAYLTTLGYSRFSSLMSICGDQGHNMRCTTKQTAASDPSRSALGRGGVQGLFWFCMWGI